MRSKMKIIIIITKSVVNKIIFLTGPSRMLTRILGSLTVVRHLTAVNALVSRTWSLSRLTWLPLQCFATVYAWTGNQRLPTLFGGGWTLLGFCEKSTTLPLNSRASSSVSPSASFSSSQRRPTASSKSGWCGSKSSSLMKECALFLARTAGMQKWRRQKLTWVSTSHLYEEHDTSSDT